MKLVLFHQYDQLLAKIWEVARCCARDAADWKICRVSASNGSVHLHDQTMNVLSVSGGVTAIVMPDIEPGKARDFMLRVEATGENTLKFEGAEAFEGEAEALQPPGDGETVVYFFTETAADILLVARKVVTRIETV